MQKKPRKDYRAYSTIYSTLWKKLEWVRISGLSSNRENVLANRRSRQNNKVIKPPSSASSSAVFNSIQRLLHISLCVCSLSNNSKLIVIFFVDKSKRKWCFAPSSNPSMSIAPHVRTGCEKRYVQAWSHSVFNVRISNCSFFLDKIEDSTFSKSYKPNKNISFITILLAISVKHMWNSVVLCKRHSYLPATLVQLVRYVWNICAEGFSIRGLLTRVDNAKRVCSRLF